jgi:hypothetical protein
MKTVFLIVAILLNAEGETFPRHHSAYKFDSLPECMSFVQGNNNELVFGLMHKLKEEGDTSQVINIGCAEMPEEDAKEFMDQYEQKPGVSA